MRTAARVDENQGEIVAALREIGATVKVTSAVGNGFTDLVVGFRSVNFLIECKDGKKVKSKRELSDEQIKFHAEWRGSIHVANSAEEAILIVTREP